MEAMQLGTSCVEITPVHPVPLAGFAHRIGVWEKVERRLYLRAWMFEQAGPDGSPARALFVQADIIWWGPERVGKLLSELEDQTGIPRSSIILHASHTHSGPQTSSWFLPILGVMEEGYVSYLEDQLFKAVRLASGNMEKVQLSRGAGTCRIGINRRKAVDGSIVMAPNPDGVTDPEVSVIRFTRLSDGRDKGILFHYTCHTTTTSDNAVSSEFAGAAVESLQTTVGEDVLVSFVQGCCGDIRPALIKEGAFHRGDAEDVTRFGEELANAVRSVLASRMDPLDPLPLISKRTVVDLPFESQPSSEELAQQAGQPGYIGQWASLLLAQPERNRPSAAMELSLIRLADGFGMVAMNGEVVVEYGLAVKKLSSDALWPVAYSNGMIGYVPTAAQVREGGYEGRESAPYFGLPAAFSPELEARLLGGIKELLAE
ncbi:alkaline ceramidase [Paenibacillus sp. J31TS4]|uniref:neutral/alkaline non-lysosomal ceramidase N-terminal domain-containing protein n=1 Tax=Paenibacillus sp. J31TS4 TaxID=2807195 RepID=UPI001B1C1476|nr:neutral/alkaline non-lysosomal ceramidase N-terminal domain-containing protein [Paenibacillus sp. J31TS4]GIP39811.1 alkaline ceramidase [Paenibacillus sp. J31TS4]